MPYRVTGKYTWEETRQVACVAHINEVVEADNPEEALKRAINMTCGYADEEASDTTDNTWNTARADKSKLTIAFIDPDDPNDPAFQEQLEKQRREEEKANLRLMEQHSTPLFADIEIV